MGPSELDFRQSKTVWNNLHSCKLNLSYNLPLQPPAVKKSKRSNSMQKIISKKVAIKNVKFM